MTKEQLITLINERIPDGDLVNIKIGAGRNAEFFDICGVDDDQNVGCWNLLAEPITSEDYFDGMIQNTKMWADAGISTQGKQWFNLD